MGGVLGVAGRGSPGSADQPQIVALVSEVIAVGMAQRVRMDAWQAGPSDGGALEVADGLPGGRLRSDRNSQGGSSCRTVR